MSGIAQQSYWELAHKWQEFSKLESPQPWRRRRKKEEEDEKKKIPRSR